MKILTLAFIFCGYIAMGQALSSEHHFDKIDWTMTLPKDFSITTPENTVSDTAERYPTQENMKRKFVENLRIFKRRFTILSINYFNFKDENRRITNKNLKKRFDNYNVTRLEQAMTEDAKFIDSASSIQMFAGVQFYKLKVDLMKGSEIYHYEFYGSLHNGYYLDMDLLYKNESGKNDVINMLNNSKFGKMKLN
jgi:hypothetical protein